MCSLLFSQFNEWLILNSVHSEPLLQKSIGGGGGVYGGNQLIIHFYKVTIK